MYKPLEFHIVGVAPLLMHNGQLADPLNKWAKAMKKITAKRKKTDEDYEELSRLEFEGGLYLDDDLAPCIPGINLEGCLVDGAKKSKLGEQFKAAVMIVDNWPLLYSGPRAVEELWAHGGFRDTRRAGIRG